jgi:aspartyl-tRNA(Asn)/glutamyl-tRNA(Gln) amidotransferase subunit A
MADAAMAGEAPWVLDAAPLAGLRLGVAQGMPLDNLDDTVGKRYFAALKVLEKAGCRLSDETLPQIDDMVKALSRASILVAEVYSIHRERLARRGDDVDQHIRARIEKGRDISASDYIDVMRERARLIRAMDARLADLDALLMPTTATVAPRIDELAEPKAFATRNALVLRNTTIVNFFDLTAITLPIPRDGGLPTGLMLIARNGHDRRLLRIAAAVERVFA